MFTVIGRDLSSGIASQGGIDDDDGAVGAVAARSGSRSDEPRHRQRSAGARGRGRGAAERGSRRRRPARQPLPTVRIDWNGLARRARQLSVPGDGHRRTDAVARRPLGRADGVERPADAAAAGAARLTPPPACTSSTSRAGSRRACRRPRKRRRRWRAAADAAARWRGGRRRQQHGLRARRAHALLPLRHRPLRRPNQPDRAPAPAAAQAGAGGGRGGGRRRTRRRRAAETEPAANATARQVTYTANVEVDRKALRAQVFNEGWRIMKNRFYDAEDARRRLGAAKTHSTSRCSTTSSTRKSCNTVMMMMIGQLNASHTGVSGGPANAEPIDAADAPPGLPIWRRIRPASTRSATSTRTAPADHDYLKIKEGHYIISVDDRDLKTSDNYWQYFTLAAEQQVPLHASTTSRRKKAPGRSTITPVAGGDFGDLQYAKWVDGSPRDGRRS